jgi:hypothetical protein
MTPTFAGEMQLAGWSESHTGGCKVTFWLQSPDDLAAFRALTVRKGNTAGHRFMAALVEIGDDEKPSQAAPVADMGNPIPRAHIGDACYRTVQWCANPEFWAFLNECHVDFAEVTNAKEAAEVVKFLCTVESRKELDTDNEANKAWHRLIREPYRVYLERQKR